MNWRIYIEKASQKQLLKFPVKDIKRIEKAIDEMAIDPFNGDIKKLDGENAWRRRVGNYRIFYQLMVGENIINIYDIQRRQTHTY